jgi:hypothetical protein
MTTFPKKAHLEPEEVLRAAYAHMVFGVDQHALAACFGVNQGRIAEVCGAIEWAIGNHMLIYKQYVLKNGEQNG